MNDLYDSAPCGMVEFTDDGIVVAVNATLLELLGLTHAELQGLHIDTILSPGGRMFFQTHFSPTLRLEQRVEDVHFDLRTKAGTTIPVLAYGVRQQRSGRAVNDCVFIHTNKRYLYESELLLAKKAAETARDAKARILWMISHDLRTPLQTIFTYAELLASPRRGLLNEPQRASVGAIQNAGREIERMLTDLLVYAQIESGSIQMSITNVSVSQALARAGSLIEQRMTDLGLSYNYDVEQDLSVRADPDRLHQVLLNLLTNAMKFTPRGGSIHVATVRHDSLVSIEVRDTGVGIDGDRLDQIFDPFVQVESQRVSAAARGIGLGLAISRQLMRAMGGDLSVRSEIGVGSVFCAELEVSE